MKEGKDLKSPIFLLLAVIPVLLLLFIIFSLSKKIDEARSFAENADNAAAAYASALAESNEKIYSADQELLKSKQKIAEISGTPVRNNEASVYSEFTAVDSEIRNALKALEQDDPDLIKNYRIRVDLTRMEDSVVSGGKGKRVRFTGNFQKMSSRKNAVIRVNGVKGSFKGKLYIADLTYDDDKNPELSLLSDEDLYSSHGASLKSAAIAALNGEKCISCETEFSEEKNGISVVIPLKDLDSSGFSKVYYDLYFEGDTSSFIFTTGCDFAGREDTEALLDDINRAFIVYRGKAAAGQEWEEALSDAKGAVDDMETALKAFSPEDPLVKRILFRLDEKKQFLDGETAEEEKKEDTEDKVKSTPEGAEPLKKTAVASYSPMSLSEENSFLLVITAVLLAFVSVVSVSILFPIKRKSEEDDVEPGIYSERNEDISLEKRGELKNEIRERSAVISEKLEDLRELSEGRTKDAALYARTEDLTERLTAELAKLRTAVGEMNGNKEPDSDADKAMTDASDSIKSLSAYNEALHERIREASAYLMETSGSVKDINKAAEIISDVASETNLLSLNASIEAARAGEAGRGFAVVAGEIQKLADETEKSVSEISGTVEKLNSDFEKTHGMMEDIGSFASSQDKAVSKALESFSTADKLIREKKAEESASAGIYQCQESLDAIWALCQELREETGRLCADSQVICPDNASFEEIKKELMNIEKLL